MYFRLKRSNQLSTKPAKRNNLGLAGRSSTFRKSGTLYLRPGKIRDSRSKVNVLEQRR